MSEDAKVVGLEDTYLSFRDVFGLPIDVLFGQYRITDPIKPTETRLTVRGLRDLRVPGRRQPDQPGLRPGHHGLDRQRPSGPTSSPRSSTATASRSRRSSTRTSTRASIDRVAQSFWKDNLRVGVLGYSGKEAGANGADQQRHLLRPRPAPAPDRGRAAARVRPPDRFEPALPGGARGGDHGRLPGRGHRQPVGREGPDLLHLRLEQGRFEPGSGQT